MNSQNTDNQLPTQKRSTKQRLTDRFLDGVERIGNRIPEPFSLFLWLFLITGVVSTVMALFDVQVSVPGSTEGPIVVKGLFTGEGLTWLTTTLAENYVGFPPLATVLVILLAVGVAEKSGLLATAVTAGFRRSPRWVMPYLVGLVGVSASVMGDAAFVVVPPLAAYVFKAAGRHPVAGLLGSFAAVGAGYSTSIVPTTLDALFAGITTAVMDSLGGFDYQAVTPLSNYYFNIASSIVLGILCGFIIDKVLEPRLVKQNISIEQTDDSDAEVPTLDAVAKKGLLGAGIATLIVTAIMLVAFLLPISPWRNEQGGFLPTSPLMDSIVFIIFVYFIVAGVTYGLIVVTITSTGDVVRMMGESLVDMLSFIVLAFVLGQFIALFNWSGIGAFTAVVGAQALQSMNFTGFGVILLFVLLASLLNLLIISGSSMWTIMAAVFVPMFALVGFEPGFVQAAFRIGDSSTQIITPLNPYMIVILGLLRRYQPEAGFGNVMSKMLPFVIPFWIAWALILGVWFAFDLPLGPGNSILLP